MHLLRAFGCLFVSLSRLVGWVPFSSMYMLTHVFILKSVYERFVFIDTCMRMHIHVRKYVVFFTDGHI